MNAQTVNKKTLREAGRQAYSIHARRKHSCTDIISVCLHVCMDVPVGLCLSVSVLLCLNLFRLWFPVTGVIGQLVQIRGHDPHWPRCQLDADKNDCTHTGVCVHASLCMCAKLADCAAFIEQLDLSLLLLPILDFYTNFFLNLFLLWITWLNKIN